MNPGPVEEAGTTARSVIDALSSQPVVLALVVFNVLYMAGSFWQATKQGEVYDHAAQRWKDLVEMAMKQCVPVTGMKLQSDESREVPLPQMYESNK